MFLLPNLTAGRLVRGSSLSWPFRELHRHFWVRTLISRIWLTTFFFHPVLEPDREEGCRRRSLYHSRLGNNPGTSNPFRPLLQNHPDHRRLLDTRGSSNACQNRTRFHSSLLKEQKERNWLTGSAPIAPVGFLPRSSLKRGWNNPLHLSFSPLFDRK